MNDIDCTNDTCGEAVGLLMTYRCNLKCKYCYIHTKRNQDMTLEKAQSILEPFLLKDGGRLDIAGSLFLVHAKFRFCHIKAVQPLADYIVIGVDDIRRLDNQALNAVKGAQGRCTLAAHCTAAGAAAISYIPTFACRNILQSQVKLFY